MVNYTFRRKNLRVLNRYCETDLNNTQAKEGREKNGETGHPLRDQDLLSGSMLSDKTCK